MNNNITHQIVTTLEAKGESKDYIIGFLTATLDQTKYLDEHNPKAINDYLNNTLKQVQG